MSSKCVRLHHFAPKFQKFPGGACPPTPLAQASCARQISHSLLQIGLEMSVIACVHCLSQIFQLTYFAGVFLVDVVTLVKGRETPWMIKLRDLFYAAVAFPCGVVSQSAQFRRAIFCVPPIFSPLITLHCNLCLPTWLTMGSRVISPRESWGRNHGRQGAGGRGWGGAPSPLPPVISAPPLQEWETSGTQGNLPCYLYTVGFLMVTVLVTSHLAQGSFICIHFARVMGHSCLGTNLIDLHEVNHVQLHMDQFLRGS